MLARSILCEALSDDIGCVRLAEVEVPEPRSGEVRIRLRACAVNFPDLLMIQGKYQFRPPLPFAPGSEAAGDVEAVGAGVSGLREGDAVVVSMRYGGFSELVNAPTEAMHPKPERLSYAKAASYQTAYLTAYVALVCRGELQAGETLLVHGATGGVGMAAVDLGKHLGATVIATGGRDDKLAVVKARGADHVLNYSQADGRLGGFRDAVKALTDGRGADLIFDPVGGDVFDESMRCINWGGRLLSIGFTSGRWPQAPVNLILIKGISVLGVRAGEYGRRHPEKGKANARATGHGRMCRPAPVRCERRQAAAVAQPSPRTVLSAPEGFHQPLPLHRTLVLLDAIDRFGTAQQQRYGRLAIANALVQAIGNLKFGPEVGVGKRKEDAPVLEAWRSNIQTMAHDLDMNAGRREVPAQAVKADSRRGGEVLKSQSVDAVITSPLSKREGLHSHHPA